MENIFKKLCNPYSAPWRHQLYLYPFWQSLVDLYGITMAPLPSHAISLFASFSWLSTISPKSFLLPIKPTHLEKRLFPSSFKSVIIFSLHGWLIVSLHALLNRCLDSSNSLKFPYHQPCASTTFFKKLHKSSAGEGPHHKVVHILLPFHSHESNSYFGFQSKYTYVDERVKLTSLFISHFSEQVMFPFILIHI